MPTYTYECKKCGHAFDVFHGMNEKPRTRCEACKGPTKRLIGMGAGIIFKGSGFYETDYKTKSGTNGSDEAKSESSKESTDKKSDSDTSTPAKSDSGAKSDSKAKTSPKPKSSKD